MYEVWVNAPGIHLAQCPDSRDTCLQLFVHFDVSARVTLDTRRLESEVLRVWLSSDGQEHVTSGDRRLAFLTIQSDDDTVALATKRDACLRR